MLKITFLENENYEHFIIAHHGRPYHVVFEPVNTIFQISEHNANTCIPQILSYVSKFYKNQTRMQTYHLWHLKDELSWLENTIEKEKLHMSTEMIAFLRTLEDLVKDVRRPTDFPDFEREMDMKYYGQKSTVYKELRTLAKKLNSVS